MRRGRSPGLHSEGRQSFQCVDYVYTAYMDLDVRQTPLNLMTQPAIHHPNTVICTQQRSDDLSVPYDDMEAAMYMRLVWLWLLVSLLMACPWRRYGGCHIPCLTLAAGCTTGSLSLSLVMIWRLLSTGLACPRWCSWRPVSVPDDDMEAAVYRTWPWLLAVALMACPCVPDVYMEADGTWPWLLTFTPDGLLSMSLMIWSWLQSTHDLQVTIEYKAKWIKWNLREPINPLSRTLRTTAYRSSHLTPSQCGADIKDHTKPEHSLYSQPVWGTHSGLQQARALTLLPVSVGHTLRTTTSQGSHSTPSQCGAHIKDHNKPGLSLYSQSVWGTH